MKKLVINYVNLVKNKMNCLIYDLLDWLGWNILPKKKQIQNLDKFEKSLNNVGLSVKEIEKARLNMQRAFKYYGFSLFTYMLRIERERQIIAESQEFMD